LRYGRERRLERALKSARAAAAVFKAYFTVEFVRNRGFIYSLLSIALWMTLFIAPLSLFMPAEADRSQLAAGALLTAIIMMAYSMATWDWGAELRWLINGGILEYIVASRTGFKELYLGVVPVSLMWISVTAAFIYFWVSAVLAPPRFALVDPLMLILGAATLITVLLAYGLILGGTMISSGVSGPVVELISFILPLASGALAPLRSMPEPIKVIALATPFSYPSELLRYSLLGVQPVLDPGTASLIAVLYAAAFFIGSAIYFRAQVRNMLREGVKTASIW